MLRVSKRSTQGLQQACERVDILEVVEFYSVPELLLVCVGTECDRVSHSSAIHVDRSIATIFGRLKFGAISELEQIYAQSYFIIGIISQKEMPQPEVIRSKQSKTGERMFYSLVEKQSESKIMFNERLLVLVDDKYFGYIQQFDRKNVEASCDPAKIKKKIQLKDVRKIFHIKNEFILMINEMDRNGRLKSIKWNFRMATPALADSWRELFEKQNASPHPSRKTTEQKDREDLSPDRLMPKKPSIKDIVTAAELITKQKPDPQQGQASTPEVVRELFRSDVFELKNEPTERAFSFQAKKSDELQVYSPPKKEAKPSPVMETLKNMELNLSSHLEGKVDFRAVQKQVRQLREKDKKQKAGQFKQLVGNLTNKQKQILTGSFLNYFRQPVGLIDDEKFQNFYLFCEIKMKQLLCMSFNDEATLRSWREAALLQNGVKIELIPTDLKEIPGNMTVCEQGLLKSYLNMMKCSDYLWRIITGDHKLRQFFVMPMACMVEYQGVIAYFVCNFETGNGSNSADEGVDVSEYFDRLAQLANISKRVLENTEMVKFVKLSSKEFVISDIGQLLPRLSSLDCMLRPEMFGRVQQFSSDNERGYWARVGRKEEEQQLKYFKKPIEDSVKTLAKNLARLDEYVIHPSEFSHLLHSYGLNLSMLSQVYALVDNPFAKELLRTEAALRAFKTVFRRRIQEFLSGPSTTRNADSVNQFTLDILNMVLGNSPQTSSAWGVISLHSQVQFKIGLSRSDINRGYFLLGIEHHLGVLCSTRYDSCDKIFRANNFVSEIEFATKVRMCRVFWLDDVVVGKQLSEASDYIMQKFDLTENKMPFFIYQQSNTAQKIFEMLSLFHDPVSPKTKHLKIYKQVSDSPKLSVFYCRRKMTEIRWLIKKQAQRTESTNLEFIEQKVNMLKQSMSYYFGPFHPFYSEMYDLLGSLYQREGVYEKNLESIKLNMTNTLQLCGGNTMHLGLASSYYQRAEFHQNWGQLDEAIGCLKKAKNILEFNSYAGTRECSLIEMKLAALSLNRGRDAEAYKLLSSSLSTFCQLAMMEVPHSTQVQLQVEVPDLSAEQQLQLYLNIVSCLEFMNRCAASELPERVEFVLQTSQLVLRNCLEPQYPMMAVNLPDGLLVRLLKLVVQNFFTINSKAVNKQFVLFVERLCDEIHVGNSRSHDPTEALNFIKELLLNDIFMSSLANFPEKAVRCFTAKPKPTLNKTASAVEKESQTFRRLLGGLILVLGEGFMDGVIKNQC